MRILVHLCCGPCGITVLQRLLDKGHECTGFFFNPNIHPLAEYMRRREGALAVTQRLQVPLLLADTLPEAEQHWDDAWGGTSESTQEQSLARHVHDGATAFAVPSQMRDLTSKGEHLAEAPPVAKAAGKKKPLPPLPLAVNPVPWLRAVSGREKERCPFCWRIRLQKTADIAKAHGYDGFTSSLLYSRYQNHEKITALGTHMADANKVIFVYEDFRTSWQEGITLSKDWGIYRQQYCGCMFSEYDRYQRDMGNLCQNGS